MEGCSIGITLFFVIPRAPGFSFYEPTPFAVDNSTIAFSRTPTNFSFNANLNLFGKSSLPNACRSQFGLLQYNTKLTEMPSRYHLVIPPRPLQTHRSEIIRRLDTKANCHWRFREPRRPAG